MSKPSTRDTPGERDVLPCRRCGSKLKPYIYFGDSVIDPKKEKRFGYEGNGIYCTLRCGFRDAVSMVKRNYR